MDRECGRLQQCSWSTFSSWRQLAQKQQLRRASGKVLLRANSAVAIWVNLLDARHMVSQAMPVCAYMQDVTDERRDLDESNCQSRRWLNLLSFSTRAIVGRSSNAYEACWDMLSLVPTVHEIQRGEHQWNRRRNSRDLPTVRERGCYNSEQHYLDTYFRLLREDNWETRQTCVT